MVITIINLPPPILAAQALLTRWLAVAGLEGIKSFFIWQNNPNTQSKSGRE